MLTIVNDYYQQTWNSLIHVNNDYELSLTHIIKHYHQQQPIQI